MEVSLEVGWLTHVGRTDFPAKPSPSSGQANWELVYFTYICTLGSQPPLKQWVFIQPPLLNPKGFNHRKWGKTIVLMVVEAQGVGCFCMVNIRQGKDGNPVMGPDH